VRFRYLPEPNAGRLAPKKMSLVAALHSDGPDPNVGADIQTYKAKEYVRAERVQLATMRRGECTERRGVVLFAGATISDNPKADTRIGRNSTTFVEYSCIKNG
jgi:hypothetical protein